VQDFLVGRNQQVAVSNIKSLSVQVLSGIPQGSVLGPLLCVCFVNDMPNIVHSSIQMFADDTKIYREIISQHEFVILQQDLNLLQDWTHLWQLKFNAEKCKVMHLGQSNDKYAYYMQQENNQLQLDATDLEKDLGVYVDTGLTFSTHCDKAVNKANKILGLIRRSYTFLDLTTMKLLFTSIVRPHL